MLMGLTLTYCSKEKVQEENVLKPMSQLTIPSDFKWEMMRDYTFVVSGPSMTVVNITSADGTIPYHKAIIPAGEQSTNILLNLPLTVKDVLVNGKPVTLGQQTIAVSLSQKELMASVNKGMRFNGTSQYATLYDKAEHQFGIGDYTIECWFKTGNRTLHVTDFRQLFSKYDFGLFKGFNVAIHSGTGKLTFTINGLVGDASVTVVDDNLYHHFAVTRSGNTLEFYLDGVLETTATDPAIAMDVNNLENFLIGGIRNGVPVNGLWDGDIDEFRVWDMKRSGASILADYMKKIGPLNVDFANLKGSWDCDEPGPVAGKAQDRTAYNNDADFMGGGTVPALMAIPLLDSDGDGVNDVSDDYPTDPLRAFNNYWPAVTPGTLAFEDLWPGTGDYDFNDLVLDYRFQTVTNASNKVVEIFCRFNVIANGANLRNGFGFQLPNATVLPGAADIFVTGYNINGVVTLAANKTEAGQTKPTFIAFTNTHDLMANYTNTFGGAPFIPPVPITLTIAVSSTDYTAADFALSSWNPFMFVSQNRGWEIHKLDNAPTSLADLSLFGKAWDASNPGLNKYYLTANNLPWVLDFPTTFSYPWERYDIRWAYLHFEEWAESGGVAFADWYSNLAPGYRNSSALFYH